MLWTLRMSAPFLNRSVANEWRNVCGETFLIIPASLQYFFMWVFFIWLLEKIVSSVNLAFCFSRADITLSFIFAEGSKNSEFFWLSENSAVSTGITEICKSILSKIGPEILFWYFEIWFGPQVQGFLGCIAYPQGQGLALATSIKSAG